MRHIRNYAVLSLVIAFLLLTSLKGCQNHFRLKRTNKELSGELSKANHKYSQQVILNDDLILKLEVADRNVKVKWRKYIVKGDSKIDTILIVENRYLPPEGKVKVEIDTSGEIFVRVKNKGFCLRPYLSVGYSNQFFYGLGFRVIYWNRFGLYLSLICPQNKKISSIFGVNYTLDKFAFLSNSLLGIGYNPIDKIGCIEFGVRF